MVKAGILAKVDEPTDWISSMVVVRRPDKLRLCIDPKGLNRALKRNNHIMPTTDDVLPELTRKKTSPRRVIWHPGQSRRYISCRLR